jgi:uncharacterized protein
VLWGHGWPLHPSTKWLTSGSPSRAMAGSGGSSSWASASASASPAWFTGTRASSSPGTSSGPWEVSRTCPSWRTWRWSASFAERARVQRIPAPLPTSPRRYREGGRWRGWLRNTALVTLYLAGVSPGALVRFYQTRSQDDGRPDPAATPRKPILLVFAKDPVPGRVKTRLAAEVGPDEAARIYRSLGRSVVDQIRGGPYRTVVCFDPPDARTAVEEWLGTHGVEFHPQSPGNLGDRLEAAFGWALEESDRVLVIGTDAPGVDAKEMEAALRTLEEADLVLGPALDGGYYLLGLRNPAPELFRGIPWSTAKVLEATRARARELGLEEVLLPPLRDVDTREDLMRLER